MARYQKHCVWWAPCKFDKIIKIREVATNCCAWQIRHLTVTYVGTLKMKNTNFCFFNIILLF